MYSDNGRGRGGPRGGYRSTSGGFARQSAAPYTRPLPPRNATSQSNWQQTPPQQQQPASTPSQLSIRGASSIPTQALVSNLAKGTSAEDVRQTFLQFGDIIRVKERRIQGADPGSVSFEVLFEERAGAKKAVEQLDRALADGRILSVVIEEDNSTSTVSTPIASAKSKADDAMSISSPIPSPATTTMSTPLGPRSSGPASRGRGGGPQRGRELVHPEASHKASVPVPRAVVATKELLQTRPLTARERKQVVAAHGQIPTGVAGKKRGNVATVVLLPSSSLPKGPKVQQQPSLQSRLGGLPLAQRLGDVKGAAKSDLVALQAKKTKQASKIAAAAAAAAAAATGQAGIPTGPKRKHRSKGKGPSNAGSGGGMELD